MAATCASAASGGRRGRASDAVLELVVAFAIRQTQDVGDFLFERRRTASGLGRGGSGRHSRGSRSGGGSCSQLLGLFSLLPRLSLLQTVTASDPILDAAIYRNLRANFRKEKKQKIKTPENSAKIRQRAGKKKSIRE